MAILFPLWLTETNRELAFFHACVIMGLLVFNIFNVRKKAKCFAGDVGSVSIAIIIVFLLLARMRDTGNFAYAGFLIVYVIDSAFTIVQRFMMGENIFRAHRRHFYQNLANEMKIPHLYVSIFYAVLQLALNWSIVQLQLRLMHVFVIALVLGLIYIASKSVILNKLKTS
jgi:UDP-N-acetylmuramyl pentapeptide phosphotransferase/UDP-N-acetylglucosamine-1-phosphate transferase